MRVRSVWVVGVAVWGDAAVVVARRLVVSCCEICLWCWGLVCRLVGGARSLGSVVVGVVKFAFWDGSFGPFDWYGCW